MTFLKSPKFQRIALTFVAGGIGALAEVPDLSSYGMLLGIVAGVLLGKAHLSKPGEVKVAEVASAPRTP